MRDGAVVLKLKVAQDNAGQAWLDRGAACEMALLQDRLDESSFDEGVAASSKHDKHYFNSCIKLLLSTFTIGKGSAVSEVWSCGRSADLWS